MGEIREENIEDGYIRTVNYCCLKDSVCVYLNNDEGEQRCKWFEQAVLLLDLQLLDLYNTQFDVVQSTNINIKSTLKLTCANCSTTFSATSRKQKYCDGCKRIVNNERSKKFAEDKKKNNKTIKL